MDINEMTKLKVVAEEKITEALKEFEDKTGLEIYSIERTKLREMGRGPLNKTAFVTLEVRL